MGADHTIHTGSTPNWSEQARRLTGGRGADVVLEVGGAETVAQSAAALREGGEIAAIGLLAGTPAWRAKDLKAKLHRIRVGNREELEDLARGIAATGIRPVVDRVFPLEKLGEALAALRAGAFFGKIAIQIAP